MKEGWEYKKLKDIATFTRGLTYSKNDEAEISNNIVLRSNNVDLSTGKLNFDELKYLKSEFSIPEEKRVKKGSLLMCMSNGSKIHLGKVALINEDYPYAFGGFMALVTPNEELNPQFFHYSLSSPEYKEFIKKLSEGANINNIKVKELELFTIPIPPLSEQQSIVDYLDSAFAKIDDMKANAEKALGEAKALFQASLKEMLEPKDGWEEKTLGELATDMYRGSGIKRDQITKEGTPCVRYGEIYTTYNFGFDKCVSYTKEEYISSPKYFEHGDLLFAITGESVEDIGKTIAYLGNEKCLCGGDIICMKHKQNPKYLAYALSTPDAVKQKGIGKTKLKVVHTNAPSIKAIRIPVPTFEEQQSIVATLDSLKSKVDTLQANYAKISQECDALKQAILRQVFE